MGCYMSKSVRVITGSGKAFFVTPKEKKFLIREGLATITSTRPLILKLKDDKYCPEYYEELRHQRGRQVEVTKCPSPDDRYPDQDWEGEFELPDRPATARKSIRCKPPRNPICEDERVFQRYKTAFLRKRSEEEADRVRMRSG